MRSRAYALLLLTLVIAACGEREDATVIDATVIDGRSLDAGPASWDMCTDIAGAPLLPQRIGTGPAPSRTGGVIIDGTYLLTDYAVYGDTELTAERVGARRRFAASAFQLATLSGVSSGTFTISTNRISFTSNCRCWDYAECQTSEFVNANLYSASPDVVNIFAETSNGGTAVATFTRE